MKKLLSLLLIVGVLGFPVRTSAQFPVPTGGDIPVIDKNAIAQLLVQIGHQLTQIKNLEAQLQNMLLHSSVLGAGGYWEILTLLTQLQSALQQGQSIAYPLQNALAFFRQTYPGYHIPPIWLDSYQSWVTTQMDTQAGMLALLSRLSLESVNDQQRFSDLAASSDSAVSRLAAIQAGNNINLEVNQQLIRLREVIMADANARLTQAAFEANDQAARVAIDVELINNVGVPWRSDMSGGIGTLPYPQ
jgi:P-type conjugative transfer protein TrbJ